MMMIMKIAKLFSFFTISITICQILFLIEYCSAASDPTDDLSTIEPEASTGCPAPDLRFTRPRVTDTTTEPPYVEFGTTQIYLPEDFTTYDIEIVEKSDIDLSGTNNNHDDTIINPYRIESDVTENVQLHENENENEHEQSQRAENRNRRNKKRRFTGGRRRRIENENGSSGGRSGRNRYKRHTIHNKNINSDLITLNKSSLPEPPPLTTNNVYYVEIADLINSGFFDKLKNDKNKKKKSHHHHNNNNNNKKNKHHSKEKNKNLLNANNNDNDNANTTKNINDNKLLTLSSNKMNDKIKQNITNIPNRKYDNKYDENSNADDETIIQNDYNNITSDNNHHNNIKDTLNVQNELLIMMTNDSIHNNATEYSDHLQRVKRKSGKTTGALSRPKGGGGDSGSKSTSRKDKGNIDEDGGYSPTHTDEESSEEDEKSSESSEHSQFTEVSEIRFPGEVGPLGDRRLCKIRCVKGKWVGPLCATNEEDDHGNVKFQPLYKSCHVNRIPPHLLLSYRNISVNVGWDLPHGHSLQARCKDLGLYKLLGESRVLCSNGLWAPRMPSCVPTTLLTNFSDDSPPSIRIKIGSGSGAFEPSGVLAVLPGSTIHLDCMYPRRRGTPEWTWTGWFKQYYTGWSTIPEEKATKYRLTIKDIQNQDSGTYTCASPRGLTNSISIIVATSQCPQLPEPTPPLSLRLEGNKLGQRALYRCPLGYTTEGTANSTCLASGNWSSPPPTCHSVQCPPLFLEDPHLSLTELNTSAWGRAVFKCSWGFRLSGPPGLECEPTGVWSGPVPRCRAIQCPQPLVPINGRIDGTSGSSSHRRYAVGALVTFSCTEGHLLVGEASIVCTETGFWSHPPPFCKSQCPYPGDPPNGLIAPLKFHYDPGDLLSVQCRPGFVEFSVNGPPERPRCLPDGNWSGPVPQCRSYEEV